MTFYVKLSEVLTALNMQEKLMAKVTQKFICINGKLFSLGNKKPSNDDLILGVHKK